MTAKITTSQIIALDFDGIFVSPEAWPELGDADDTMIRAVSNAIAKGHRFILNTCRTKDALRAAIWLLWRHGVKPVAINSNLPELVEKYGSDPRKISADFYIDDRAVGYDRETTINWLNDLPDVRTPRASESPNLHSNPNQSPPEVDSLAWTNLEGLDVAQATSRAPSGG